MVSVAKKKNHAKPCHVCDDFEMFFGWQAGTYIYIFIFIYHIIYIYEGMYSCMIPRVCYRYVMVGVERYDYFLRGTVPSNVLYSQSISSQKF